LKQQQAADQVQQIATAMQAAIKFGQDPAQVAKKYGLKLSAEKFVNRSDAGVPAPVLSAAFAAPKPMNGTSESGAVALANGDQAVYMLTGVKAGDVSALSKDQRTAQMQELIRFNAESEFAAYLANLRQHAKITIHPNNIQE
ncbi:MAG: hypothetical protein ACRESO_04055, partial [Gammaproteobacteria bacterium]